MFPAMQEGNISNKNCRVYYRLGYFFFFQHEEEAQTKERVNKARRKNAPQNERGRAPYRSDDT